MSGSAALVARLYDDPRESTLNRPAEFGGSVVVWRCRVTDKFTGTPADVDGAEFWFVPPDNLIPVRVPATRLGLGLYAVRQGLEYPGQWIVQFRSATGLILDQRGFDILPSAVSPNAQPAAILTTPEGFVITLDGMAIGGTP
jgi:hypothetical protein